MIKRINILKHVGRFIELRSNPGADHDFTQLNVIYAENASGKSTLCDIMRSMAADAPDYVIGRKRLGAGNDPEIVITLEGTNPPPSIRFQNSVWTNATVSPPIHVYDERFVAENVLVGHQINIEHRRNLYELVIGGQGIALKQAVDEADQAQERCRADTLNAEAALRQLLPEGQTVDSFRNIPEVTNVDQEIIQGTDALETARQLQSKADAMQQRPSLPTVISIQVPTNVAELLAFSLGQTALIAERKVREHLQAHTSDLSIDWLRQGHRGKVDTGCPFCGQSMDGLDILQVYNAFFSGELQAQEHNRTALRGVINNIFGEEVRNRIRRELTAHDTERTWWADAAGFAFTLPDAPNQEAIIAAHEAVQTAIINALDRKQADPGTAMTLDEDEQQAVATWEGIFATLTEYNSGVSAINERLGRKKAEAERIELTPLQLNLASLTASKRRHQEDVIEAYTAFNAAVLARTEAQTAKREANETLRQQTNSLLAQYGTRINELLDLFTANFQIVCGGNNDNYVSFSGGQPSGQLAIEILGHKIIASPGNAANPALPSLANTISGGDRSALALAFFLAKVEQETDLADSIVVFDDPFHSQDRSRQCRTIERIHSITRDANQCFVFSHDLDFARAVSPIQEVHSRTFVLDPLADRTTLESQELPMLPSRAYEAKYRKLTAFISNPSDFSTQLNEIAGILRTVLEEYLQLKYPLRWETGVDWFGTMIGKIRSATGDDPLITCQALVTDLTSVNEYSQRFHHRATGATADVPDARELRTYAQQTLRIIHQ